MCRMLAAKAAAAAAAATPEPEPVASPVAEEAKAPDPVITAGMLQSFKLPTEEEIARKAVKTKLSGSMPLSEMYEMIEMCDSEEVAELIGEIPALDVELASGNLHHMKNMLYIYYARISVDEDCESLA